LHVISVVSGVPDILLRRLLSSSICPWLRWKKTEMDWSRLIGSSSCWPGSSSCESGSSLLSALSVGGPLTPPRSVAPPSSPSPLVSRTSGIKRLLRSVSSTFRFSVVGPSLFVGLGLRLAPTSDLPCQGRFSSSRFFISGSGCSVGFSSL